MNLDLSVIDVPVFLRSLGCENVRAELSEVRFSCPLPAHSYGDKNPSAYMNINTTAWICFSCGAKGNAITFLSEVMDVPHATAKQWIAEKWAPHYADIEDLYEFLMRSFERGITETGAVEEPVVILPEEVLEGRRVDWRAVDAAGLEAPGSLRYMLERGFKPTILSRFDISYDRISDRPCLTVRDENGDLVGFKGRAWNDEQFPRYCNTPEAPILMGDLTFKPISAVRVGDKVIGWEDGKTTNGRWGAQKQKVLAESIVEKISVRHNIPVVRITMESGRQIRCTEDHHWLINRGQARRGGEKHVFFAPAKEGLYMTDVIDPKGCEFKRDGDLAAAMWLSGMFDGEGYADHRSIVIAQCRNHNPEVCKRLEYVLNRLGFEWSYDKQKSGGSYRIKGSYREAIRMSNMCVPARRERLVARVLGRAYWKRADKIISIESDGVDSVYSMQTSTGNYVAWGYASKNCILGDTERGIAMYGQRYGFAPYDASKIVFGLHLAEPINDTLVVCEGELNVIAMHQMGFTNTVGPSGSTLSQRFVDIVASECSKAILLFDSDLGSETSAATAKIKLLTAIEQFDRLVDVFVCPDHVGDPNDMTQADVDNLIRAAQNSTLYRVEHLLDERR